MLRSAALALALTLAAGCSPGAAPDATKAGETVLSWELAGSDRESIRAAAISDVKASDLEYEGDVVDDVKVKVKIHLETATVVFTEDGKEVTHRAPVKVVVEAIDAAGFALSPLKCMGPHYTMDLPPAQDMILHCYAKAVKPRYDVSFSFYAYGDGHVDAGTKTP